MPHGGNRCVLWSISRGALNLKSQKSKNTGKSRGASNLKNTICRHDAYLDGFFWQNAWSSRFKKLTFFTKYRSFWFKAKKARSFWFKGEKVMELLLYLGVASVQQWVQICTNVHVVRPQNSGSSRLKETDFEHFPRSFRFEKREISIFLMFFNKKVNEPRSFRFNVVF